MFAVKSISHSQCLNFVHTFLGRKTCSIQFRLSLNWVHMILQFWCTPILWSWPRKCIRLYWHVVNAMYFCVLTLNVLNKRTALHKGTILTLWFQFVKHVVWSIEFLLVHGLQQVQIALIVWPFIRKWMKESL